MKKRVIIGSFIIAIFIVLSVISAQSVESEIQKLTHYAEEYETGNIDYAQLVVYSASVRENLQEIAGVIDEREGGILDETQVQKIIGAPTGDTKWVWDEKIHKERKLNAKTSTWEKTVFDGNNLQIKLDAYPSFYAKHRYDEETGEEFIETEEKIIYRLYFDIVFKKPREQIDIPPKIEVIKNLAEQTYNDQTTANIELLAQESVNAEKAFSSYVQQGSLQCEATMNSIFGSEHKTDLQSIIIKEMVFFEGNDFEVRAQLEMCGECNWHWVDLRFWTEQRGFNQQEEQDEDYEINKYEGYQPEEFKREITASIENLKKYYENKDFASAEKENNKIHDLNQAWNEKANNVWDEINQQYTLNQNPHNDRYFWIKQEQEKREKAKELQKNNYEEREQFYEFIFRDYEIEESSFQQDQWEKRLFEKFRENGEEICDNAIDDNNNNQIDCSDPQCNGKKVGEEKKIVGEGEQAQEKIMDLYCIAGEIKPKEEIIQETMPVCGNHICEINEYKDDAAIPQGLSEQDAATWNAEHVLCPVDCSLCPVHKPIACEGNVIFKGKDENGCPLEPVCIEEQGCETNDDCKTLCGIGSCIKGETEGEGVCSVTALTECKESECNDGEEKKETCQNGDIIIRELCEQGLWKSTGLVCEGTATETREITQESEKEAEKESGEMESETGKIVEEISGNSCITKTDCGNEADVCSNGFCVTLPEVKTVDEDNENEIEEVQEGPVENIISGTVETVEVTSQVIFHFFISLKNNIQQTITTKVTHDSDEQNETSEESKEDEQNNEVKEEQRETDEERRQREEREQEREGENRREQEREERESQCTSHCNDNCELIIEECVREKVFVERSDKMNDLEESKSQCKSEKKESFDSCISSCTESCVKGEDFRPEVERQEHKEEIAVFQAGGSCRTTTQGKTQDRNQASIHFDGWGQPFQDLHLLKNKYYRGGNSDWCKEDIKNLIRQREEFEKGFNEAFAHWFFEQYLANSAEDWQEHVSGIYELYWKNVDTQRQLAERMRCLGEKDITDIFQPQLLNFKYKGAYGSIEYWEELQTVKIEGIDEKVEVISPYMKLWVFPNKAVIVSEMKHAMEKHTFPGPEGEAQTNVGPSDEDKRMLYADEAFMEEIREIATQYDHGLSGIVQLKNFETNDIIFNILVTINEEDIFTLTPLLPSENPSSDVTIELDFDRVYGLIETTEKEMRSTRVERPPWDTTIPVGESITQFIDGIQMYFKMRSLINNARVTPEKAEKDIKKITKWFLWNRFSGDEGERQQSEEDDQEEEKTPFAAKESITGEMVR